MDKDILDKIAKNARLELTEKEKKEFLPQLSDVLDSFSKIAKIDTGGVEPSLHPVKIDPKTRDDIPKESLSQELALKNSKNNRGGRIVGPKVA